MPPRPAAPAHAHKTGIITREQDVHLPETETAPPATRRHQPPTHPSTQPPNHPSTQPPNHRLPHMRPSSAPSVELPPPPKPALTARTAALTCTHAMHATHHMATQIGQHGSGADVFGPCFRWQGRQLWCDTHTHTHTHTHLDDHDSCGVCACVCVRACAYLRPCACVRVLTCVRRTSWCPASSTKRTSLHGTSPALSSWSAQHHPT